MMEWTTTPNKTATRTVNKRSGEWADLIKSIQAAGEFKLKDMLPLIKLATLGTKPNDKGSLRHDANIVELTGVIGDYDAEKIPMATAVELLEKAGLKAFLYTSASHTPDAPRWRVVCPLSKPHAPDAHEALTARLNGALGGILANESFTRAQFYFYGRVAGVAYEEAVTFDDADEGGFIDTLDELDDLAIFKNGATSPEARATDSAASSFGGFAQTKWSVDEFERKVQELGRPLRTGDGRREMLKRTFAALSAKGMREPDLLVTFAEGAICAKYFDHTDPLDHANLLDLAQWATRKDNASEARDNQRAAELMADFEASKAAAEPQSEPQADAQAEPAPKPAKAAKKSEFVPVYTPARPGAVVAKFKELGQHMRQEKKAHIVVCPCCAAKGGEPIAGKYIEPSATYKAGGFKCSNGHDLHQVLAVLGMDRWEAEGRARIRVEAAELHQVIDGAEHVLSVDPDTFQQPGGMLVKLRAGETGTGLRAMGLAEVTRELSERVFFEKYDARAGDYRPHDVPDRHAKLLFESPEHKFLRVVEGIARQPFFRNDGTLCMAPGYDLASRTYGAFNDGEFWIPDAPTRDDALEALGKIGELLSGFPFVSARDRVVAIAGCITGAIRSSLPFAPLFFTNATQAGSGKTTLAKVQGAFCTPDTVPAQGYPTEAVEATKAIMATLMTGPQVINFDNLSVDMKAHPVLCSVLTEPSVKERVLGFSRVVTVSTRVLILGTGNNVRPIDDLTRRSLVCSLNPKVENAAAVRHAFDPVALMTEKRAEYVSAALTVIRAYQHAGSPHIACDEFNTYQVWSDMVRKPLLWLNMVDPVDCVAEAMAEDPVHAALSSIAIAWRAAFGTVPTQLRTACAAAEAGSHDLREALMEVCEERGALNRLKLGWFLKRNQGRTVGGYAFVGEKRGSGAHWALRPVKAPAAQTEPAIHILAEEFDA